MYTLLEAKKKGIPIVVIDPRKSDTVLKLGAEWIPLKPATDSALMDGMAYAIVEAGLEDREFLDRVVWDSIRSICRRGLIRQNVIFLI